MMGAATLPQRTEALEEDAQLESVREATASDTTGVSLEDMMEL